MARIDGVNLAQAEGHVARVLDGQARIWGSPLNNHLIYARRPSLFKGVRGMWAALEKGNLIEPGLVALINRRVAQINGCVF